MVQNHSIRNLLRNDHIILRKLSGQNLPDQNTNPVEFKTKATLITNILRLISTKDIYTI